MAAARRQKDRRTPPLALIGAFGRYVRMTDVDVPGAVLIVEDEPIIRMVAAYGLADDGLVTYEAADAAEALTVLAQHPEIAVLFTDINMPGEMDGLGLATRVFQLRPDTEFIVTSGRERLRDATLPDHGTFLPKLYRISELVGLVEAKLRAYGSAKAV